MMLRWLDTAPLGAGGGARGVDDDDVVVGIERLVRRLDPALRLQQRIVGSRPRRRGPHGDDLDLAPYGAQPLQPLGVREDHARAGVLQRLLHLGGRPPRVHGHRDGAQVGGGEEGHHPLRVVAHRDRHPIAFRHPEALAQDPAHPRGPLVHGGEVQILGFVGQVAVAAEVGAGALQQVAYGLRRAPEHAARGAAHLALR
jgi:hypothetical protein